MKSYQFCEINNPNEKTILLKAIITNFFYNNNSLSSSLINDICSCFFLNKIKYIKLKFLTKFHIYINIK